MISYYEELSIDRDWDTEHIREELVRLESLWHKREVNSPEKANKMLGLIMEAQKVFASEASRKKYDSEFENSQKETENPDAALKRTLEKWTEQARGFFNSCQYDLAKAAMDKALSYAGRDDDGDLFQLAASIYLKNDEIHLAMDCINKAIILSQDWASYYVTKAQIFERMAQTEQQYDKRLDDINECRSNLKLAVSKAHASGLPGIEGIAYGMLAFSLYFHPNEDVVLAEEYALCAQSLGESANSKRVLDSIKERTNIPIYNEAKEEEIYGDIQHYKKALELYSSLGDWHDAPERANKCRFWIERLEEAKNRREEEERRLREEREKKAKERAEEQARRTKAELEERERRAQAELEAKKRRRELTVKLAKIVAPIAAFAIVMIILIKPVFIPNGKYHNALRLMKDKNYDEAIVVFQSLNGFRSSERKIDKCHEANIQKNYDIAAELMKEGKYVDAIEAYKEFGEQAPVKDIPLFTEQREAIGQACYDKAVSMMEEGNLFDSYAIFSALGDYENSLKYMSDIRRLQVSLFYKTIAIGKSDTYALKNDGTVMSTSKYDYSYLWSDIIAVSAGDMHCAALQTGGRVCACNRE